MRSSKTFQRIVLTLVATLQSSAVAQSDAALRTFEVASVRQHQGPVFRSGPFTVIDPLIRLEGYTIYGLVLDAYGLRDFQLKISPDIPKDAIYNTMYDVMARAPGTGVPRIEEAREMLQNLLADRFKLRVHREVKEMQVYALTVGRGATRLKASSTGGQCSVSVGLANDGRNNEEVFSGCPIERLADRLTNLVGNRPVLDQTGLRGRYDFRLAAVPEFRTRGQSDPADIDPVTATGELGLKLVPQKAPVDVIAVDHLEKPTEN
jgi:uncharacterized protein (TIGR03435 family)